ncbi:MAG: NUDIX domain-containing protein [Roseiarcus sp.]|jgi:ADP-ribose pyrophosphatase YjhB (NUDIX family)
MTDPAGAHNLFHVPPAASYADAAAAIIFLDDGRYLMQLRDDKPGIFFPDHWGLFGGAREPGEALPAALRRELREELNYDAEVALFFTRMEFGFEILGAKRAVRDYYEVRMPSAAIARLELREGRALQALTATEILLEKRVVPYDSFAIWMHQAWIRQDTGPCRQS